MERGKLKILACSSGRSFAEKVQKKIQEKISNETQLKLVKTEEVKFANTEIKEVIGESLRECDVYIFQDVSNSANGLSVDENLSALKAAIDAVWRSDADHITVIVPVFPYARQEKQEGREGITAAVVARELEDLNADQVITLDVHNSAIAGFFRKAKFENLHASKNIIDYINKNKDFFDTKNLVVVSPDAGGVKRAKHYAHKLKTKLAFAYKERNYDIPNSVDSVSLVGDVKEKDVLIVDDMIDTAGTLISVIEEIKKNGAKKVYVACSLALFNGKAIERVNNAYKKGIIDGVIGTDAVYQGGEFRKNNLWYHEVSVASYFAKVIMNLNQRKSISALLE